MVKKKEEENQFFRFTSEDFSNDNTRTISTFQLLPFWQLQVSNSILNTSEKSTRSYTNSKIPTLQTANRVDVLTINKTKKNKCVQSIKGSRLSLAKKAGDVKGVGVYVQKGLNTQQSTLQK